MRAMRRLLVALVLLVAVGTARADEYHYNDVFMGPRATGLAGTMIGLADDPSAAYYNPAGLAHADHETVSLSTTAVLGKTLTLEGYLGGDLDLDSSAAFSPAGVTTSPFYKGRLALMGMTPSYDAYRVSRQSTDLDPLGGVLSARIGRERADSTYLVGLGYGQEVGRDLDLGVSACYVYRSYREHRSDFRHFSQPRPDGSVAFERSFDEKGISHGAMVVLGLLYHPFSRDGSLRLGLTARSGANVSTSASLQQTEFIGNPDPGDPGKVVFSRRAPDAQRSGAGSRLPPSLGVGVSGSRSTGGPSRSTPLSTATSSTAASATRPPSCRPSTARWRPSCKSPRSWWCAAGSSPTAPALRSTWRAATCAPTSGTSTAPPSARPSPVGTTASAWRSNTR
jgi:hypothetical protein